MPLSVLTTDNVDLLRVARQIEDLYEENGDDVTVWVNKARTEHGLSPAEKDELFDLLYDRLRCKLG